MKTITLPPGLSSHCIPVLALRGALSWPVCLFDFYRPLTGWLHWFCTPNRSPLASLWISALGAILLVSCSGSSLDDIINPKKTKSGYVKAIGGDMSVGLFWSASVGAASYNIYWDTAGGLSAKRARLRMGPNVSGVTSTSYVHKCLSNGTAYYYLVTPVSSSGVEGEPMTAELSATPPRRVRRRGWKRRKRGPLPTGAVR